MGAEDCYGSPANLSQVAPVESLCRDCLAIVREMHCVECSYCFIEKQNGGKLSLQ